MSTSKPDNNSADDLHPPLKRYSLVLHSCVLASALGYGLALLMKRPPLAAMASGDLLDSATRADLVSSILLWTALSLIVLTGLWCAVVRRRPWVPGVDTLAALVTGLWPLTLLPLAVYGFDRKLWPSVPLTMYVLSFLVCGYCVYRTIIPESMLRVVRWRAPRPLPWVVLALAMAAYAGYVSFHTIQHHYALGTSAYDLGIHENFLWNTINGAFFHSSIEGGSHLGVHTSFVMLLIAPIYAAVPHTETLLIIQALALALAAWPLACSVHIATRSPWTSVVVGVLWLSHPGVGGANFYDFHALALAPVLLFGAVWMWQAGRWRWFWLAVVLLLTVKEDTGFLVVALGMVLMIMGERRRGMLAIALGTLSYLVLQHAVIPHFAGTDHSYTWYFEQVIPRGEGPAGALVTAMLSPVYALKVALTPEKVLYLLQLLTPLALLPLRTVRGALLLAYGLAAALLASRPAMFELGFQYALVILAPAFVALVVLLGERTPAWRNRALTAAVMLSVLTSYHYGMIWPRHNFSGGFRTIDFVYDEADRGRLSEVTACASTIPADVSVLASETLVPHVARRRTVATVRDLERDPGFPYDALFLLKSDRERLVGFAVDAAQRRGLVTTHDGEHCVLMLRPAESAASARWQAGEDPQ